MQKSGSILQKGHLLLSFSFSIYGQASQNIFSHRLLPQTTAFFAYP
jgi:hypothetical protein